MKYIAKNIITSVDETPAALRRKVAEKLGVSSLGLRIKVIRREWRRGKTGGYLVVNVEAETNEFIHNTAFFASDNEGSPLPETTLKRRPVVVGLGLRGAVAAYALSVMGLKPIVLETGDSLNKREAQAKQGEANLRHGEGGLSAYTGMLLNLDNLDATLRRLLSQEGIHFESTDAHQYLPPAFLKSLVKSLTAAIVHNGGDVIFNARFTGTRSFLGKLAGAVYEQNGERKFVKTDRIIIANGMLDNAFYLGFSLESSLRKFNEFVYGKTAVPANLPPYFACSYYAPKTSNRCMLITGLPRPCLLDIGSQKERTLQAFEFSLRNKSAVSFLGVQLSKDEATRITKEAYNIAKPHSIPCSTVGDFLERKDPLKLGQTKPSDLAHINLACLNRLYGPTASGSLEKALSQFGRAFPYLLQRDAIVEGMILLRGYEDEGSSRLAARGIYVPEVSPADSLDFASMSSSAFRAAIRAAGQGRKAH